MNHANFPQITDKVLLQKLDSSIRRLHRRGFTDQVISDFTAGIVKSDNRDTPATVTYCQLNRFLWERNLPNTAGRDHSQV